MKNEFNEYPFTLIHLYYPPMQTINIQFDNYEKIRIIPPNNLYLNPELK
jgi:hypothetical protein